MGFINAGMAEESHIGIVGDDCKNTANNWTQPCMGEWPMLPAPGGEKMNVNEFLNMILDEHHGGWFPEEEAGERDPTWEKEEQVPHLGDGCEWNDAVNK